MVRFDGKSRDGWVNNFISADEIREENLFFHRKEWDGKPLPYYTKPKRLVVEIDESGFVRKYIFRGVFVRDDEKTDPYKVRYYKKISDIFELNWK